MHGSPHAHDLNPEQCAHLQNVEEHDLIAGWAGGLKLALRRVLHNRVDSLSHARAVQIACNVDGCGVVCTGCITSDAMQRACMWMHQPTPALVRALTAHRKHTDTPPLPAALTQHAAAEQAPERCQRNARDGAADLWLPHELQEGPQKLQRLYGGPVCCGQDTADTRGRTAQLQPQAAQCTTVVGVGALTTQAAGLLLLLRRTSSPPRAVTATAVSALCGGPNPPCQLNILRLRLLKSS
jgi:hypothetical protein